RTLLDAVTDGTREQVTSMYAAESVVQELFYLCGPLLVALLAMFSPWAVVAGTVAAGFAGTIWLASLPVARHWRSEAHPADGLLPPLGSPAVRALLVTAALTGAALGSLEIAIPAFAPGPGSTAG